LLLLDTTNGTWSALSQMQPDNLYMAYTIRQVLPHLSEFEHSLENIRNQATAINLQDDLNRILSQIAVLLRYLNGDKIIERDLVRVRASDLTIALALFHDHAQSQDSGLARDIALIRDHVRDFALTLERSHDFAYTLETSLLIIPGDNEDSLVFFHLDTEKPQEEHSLQLTTDTQQPPKEGDSQNSNAEQPKKDKPRLHLDPKQPTAEISYWHQGSSHEESPWLRRSNNETSPRYKSQGGPVSRQENEGQSSSPSVIHLTKYVGAKVVLLGESGIGKTCLSLALNGEAYRETETTIGCNRWTLKREMSVIESQHLEEREVLLWDMAGNQESHMIHQLYLDNVTVALFVVNLEKQFEDIYYWERVLRQLNRYQNNTNKTQKLFLVVTHNDQEGTEDKTQEIEHVVQKLSLDGYFQTSVKNNIGIDELRARIFESIVWNEIPKINTSGIFHKVKQFLVDLKKENGIKTNLIVLHLNVLYKLFLRSGAGSRSLLPTLSEQFEKSIELMAQSGLIKWLSFGKFLLLQPEYLDRYASALIMAVSAKPDGLGSISELEARQGDFCATAISPVERISDNLKERLLLITVIEDLLDHDLVVRNDNNLLFPSQVTKLYDIDSVPPGRTISFKFEGAITNIYSTLVIRLMRSGLFQPHPILYNNRVEYVSKEKGACSLYLENQGRATATLAFFFDPARPISEDLYYLLEEFITSFLEKNALNVTRTYLYSCVECAHILSPDNVAEAREKGLSVVNCPQCEHRIEIVEPIKSPDVDYQKRIEEIEEAIRVQRNHEILQHKLEARQSLNDYDMFFCYNHADSESVQKIADQLIEMGILPWLFERDQRLEPDWRERLQDIINMNKSGVVFQSNNGMSIFQQKEIVTLLSHSNSQTRSFPITLAILPGTADTPTLTSLSSTQHVVDFRKNEPDPIESLIKTLILGDKRKEAS
jgi:small GTP-binding protein